MTTEKETFAPRAQGKTMIPLIAAPMPFKFVTCISHAGPMYAHLSGTPHNITRVGSIRISVKFCINGEYAGNSWD